MVAGFLAPPGEWIQTTVLRPLEPDLSLVVRWGFTFTGTACVIPVVELDDLATASEIQAALVGEAEIERGDYVTLEDLENEIEA